METSPTKSTKLNMQVTSSWTVGPPLLPEEKHILLGILFDPPPAVTALDSAQDMTDPGGSRQAPGSGHSGKE